MNSIRPDQGVEELGWGIISHRLKSSAKPETAFHLTTIQERKKAKKAFVLIGTYRVFPRNVILSTGVNKWRGGGAFPLSPGSLNVLNYCVLCYKKWASI